MRNPVYLYYPDPSNIFDNYLLRLELNLNNQPDILGKSVYYGC